MSNYYDRAFIESNLDKDMSIIQLNSTNIKKYSFMLEGQIFNFFHNKYQANGQIRDNIDYLIYNNSYILLLNNIPIGTFSLYKGYEDKCIYFGYTVYPHYQKLGLGTKIVKEIIKFIKNNYNNNKIYAIVHENNSASKKIMVKNHFQFINKKFILGIKAYIYSYDLS